MTQQEVLTILQTGASVFLTGEPGSGKSYTVSLYVSWLRSCGVEPAITASTGIAATHIGGVTIHSWSGIGIKKFLSDYDLDFISQNKRIVDQVSEAKVLIIDEVSMLGGTTLTMVDQVCRTIKNNSRPFGGLQVLLVGDFFQLPPVQKYTPNSEELFDSEASIFSFGSPAWAQLKPIVCYLHEQHRQEDDLFLDILSALRLNNLTEKHLTLLHSRLNQPQKENIPKLYSHNEDVDRINEQHILALAGDARTFHMQSIGAPRLVENLKKGCLSPETLVLKIGAQVMFTKNDFVRRLYANGTLGAVVGFATDTGLPLVKLHNGRTITVEAEDWSVVDNNRILASISQLPLRLAWAMTVHKSQGMSLDAAHMDLSQAFEYGQGYVALSRVRTLSGLFLSGLNKRALEVHPEILEKDLSFREESDVAADAFEKLGAEELQKMKANFIRAIGGTLPEERKEKIPAKQPAEGKKFSVEALRQKYPNAYKSWSEENDQELQMRFEKGESQKAIAAAFGRQPGSIRARLLKLGLIEEIE